jgi:hypothetical protein
MFGPYTKAILGTLAATATWLTTAVSDGHISAVEWSGLMGVVVSAIVIAGSTNTEPSD